MINNINKEKFVRVQYTCHRAGKIKSESSGERPNQIITQTNVNVMYTCVLRSVEEANKST